MEIVGETPSCLALALSPFFSLFLTFSERYCVTDDISAKDKETERNERKTDRRRKKKKNRRGGS
jgi:hypothetical protein